MKVIGIEIDSNRMNYVVVELINGEKVIRNSSRIILSETRSRAALTSFQDAIKTLYNSVSPDLIGIKEKPEAGKMKAGAAAMKMEGIILANAPCNIDFVSGKRINQSNASDENLYGYLQAALKAADAALANVEE